jgi:hypothetical protein
VKQNVMGRMSNLAALIQKEAEEITRRPHTEPKICSSFWKHHFWYLQSAWSQ